MSRIFLAAVGLLATSLASAGWQVQWIERFEGDGVDWSNWTAQTTANFNNEVQCYTDDDSSPVRNYEVSDGTLKIIARRMGVECPGQGGAFRSWTSGRLNSKGKREFLFGRVEARIRFHHLQGGTWPAFWMLERRINQQPLTGDGDTVSWPNPGASEIDVWEWFANDAQSYIINFFNTGGFACGFERRHPYPNGAADVLDWHTYAMEWTADSIRFLFDGQEVASYDMRACDVYEEPMFVLLNLAMGGNLGGAIDPALNEAVLEVDYVAHCQQSEASPAEACNEATPVGFTFDYANDSEGQWVAVEPEFSGNAQGLAFDYMGFADLLFVAWFTYVDPAAAGGEAGFDAVGAADNRWLTAQLAIDGNTASGPVFASTGGAFDSPPRAGQESVEVGTMTIEFEACDRALVDYRIDTAGLERRMIIRPLQAVLAPSGVCRSLVEAVQ